MLNKVPVIDLFAGPGGLAEGFSSISGANNNRIFDVKLSVEKDQNAHSTLELRSFFRQFKKEMIPEEYYQVLREADLTKRRERKLKLFQSYPEEYKIASTEAWLAELGSVKFPSDLVDLRIKKGLKRAKNWVLIGGPPCQAYSMAGRSRVGGINEEDHRVFLYKEYLRIIAKHSPSVFVMENVKGLLSAQVNGEKVFDWILRDLRNPSSVFPTGKKDKYKIYSLSTPVKDYDEAGNPIYKNGKDFLIKSEKFGVPQKRHRIILLGIREDINVIPKILSEAGEIKLNDIIGDLPKLRSGISKSIVSSEIINGRKKRVYQKEDNSNQNWERQINSFKESIANKNGFSEVFSKEQILAPKQGLGSEFVKCNTPNDANPMKQWYQDERLEGACNHETRTHLLEDLKRYMFSSMYAASYNEFPRMQHYQKYVPELLPDHESARTGKFADRFRVQMPGKAATTVTSHISKDGHYFIHYDYKQCRSLTVREAARIQTFPDNYLFCGSRTAQYHQVGNAVPPYLAKQIAEVVYDLMKKHSVNPIIIHENIMY
jgi:DNA (cytosine-5)-methyltransferase 1